MTEVAELSTSEKRNRIETELYNDPNRSDREIARVIGCDHKTVGAARERVGNSPTPPSATEIRSMLIEGCKNFDNKFPDAFDPRTAEEVVDDAVRDGKLTLKPGTGGGEEDTVREYYWTIPRQHAIECRALAGGDVEVWQEGQHGDNDAAIVHVAAGNVVMLARHLLYAAGFKSITIATYVPGEGMEDIEDGSLAATFYPAEAKR